MMDLDPNYDYLIEDGKIVCKVKKLLFDGKAVDHNDFSFRNKKKFDKIDNVRVDKLNYVSGLGKEKRKEEVAKYGSKDLRRWGYEA